MSRPDWCPQKIWNEAIKVEGGSNPMLVERIARAILAAEQRERAACLAATYSCVVAVPPKPGAPDGAQIALNAVRTALSNRGEHHD